MHDHYMKNAFSNQRKNIANAKKRIITERLGFDSIAVQGISGIVFGTLLAYEMKKNLIIVRKSTKESLHTHHKRVVTQKDFCKRWIFVDDLIDSGKTFIRVKKAIHEEFGSTAQFVGGYLYSEHEYLHEEP